MNSLIKLLIFGLTLGGSIFVTGCASTSPFQPAEAHLRYWVEEDIGPDSFRIYYQGGGPASEERIIDFALLRACHVAQEWDCKYFAVVNEALSTSERRIYDTEAESMVLRRQPRLVIKCFASRPKGVFVFRAKAIETAIQRKYRAGEQKARS